MLTLSLFRHAKSSWANPGQQDFDRPLNERGLGGSPAHGRFHGRARHRARARVVLALGAHAPDARSRAAALSARSHRRLRGRDLSRCRRRRCSSASARSRPTSSMHDRGSRSRPAPAGHGAPGSGDPDAMQALAQKFPTAALAVIVFEGRSLVEGEARRRPARALHVPETTALDRARDSNSAKQVR